MMKEPFPFSIGFRLPETFRVILNRFPRRKQKILVRRLHAWPDFNPKESRCSCDQWHRLSQRRFKFLRPARYDPQYCVFDNQQAPPLFRLLRECLLLLANTQRNPRANDRRTGRNPARFLRADVLKIEFCNLLSVNWLAKKHLVKLPLASVRESYPLHALIGCIVINQFKRGLFEP